MNKVLPYLGASLSILALTLGSVAYAQDSKPFTDVPPTHWAYEAVTSLQQKGVIVGYPGGYFRGKRTLTRYEFAIALDRALKALPTPQVGPPGPQGPQGEPGPKGDTGPAGMTPEEVNQLKALAQEFRNELSQIGANVKDIQNRLDALSRDVADIKDRLNKQIQFGAEFFGGFRSDRSRYTFLDYSGAPRSANNSLAQNVDAVHDFHLQATGNLPGGVKAKVDLVASNYLGYRANGTTFLGGPGAANANGNLPEQSTLYEADITVPVGGAGSPIRLTVGRYKNQFTPLTYYRPDTDAYFDVPWYDDGNWVEDGFKLESKFGSARTTLFAGSYTGLRGSSSTNLINQPLVGANFGPRTFAQTQPFGLSYKGAAVTGALGAFNDDRGQILAQESLGLHVDIPIHKVGEFGATIISFGGNDAVVPQAGTPYSNVVVYGLNFKLHSIGRFNISGEAAKSVTQATFSLADPYNSNDDDNAFNANVSYNSGPVQATAGYQYIDPRFGAPGYWNKIGNWYNPTNIQGPFARLNYNFSSALVGSLGGDYYSGARNRIYNGGTASATGFSKGSSLYRGTAGLKYNINKTINVGAEYEGVFWDLSGSVTPTGRNAKPLEQFITAKLGLNLASNTVLSLAYQIINAQNNENGFGTVVPGLTDATGGHTSNATVFTTQVAVKF